ncbi:MAG: hypothetical protein LBE24_08130 [Methylobacillus sp.]|jgi:hypothetical protein|nr:hypothetical protein [Methylobacillus sp.]
MRLLLLALCGLALPALAIDRVEIHIGKIEHPGAKIEKISGTLNMDGRWHGRAMLKHGDAAQLAKEFTLPFAFSKGELRGWAEFSGEQKMPSQIRGEFFLKDVAFNDETGLHAGEKIAAHLQATATREGEQWRWTGKLGNTGGEVFWSPLYFDKMDIGFDGRGVYAPNLLSVEQSTLTVGGVGSAQISAALTLPENSIKNLDVTAQHIDMAGAYTVLLKPLFEKTMLANLEMEGQADASVSMKDGTFTAFHVALRDFDVADKNGAFEFYKVNADVPWSLNQGTKASLRYAGGQLLKMNLGATEMTAALNGYALTTPQVKLPVLDGTLTLTDVSAELLQEKWHWHMGATLTPVSMSDFSRAVGWPAMDGKLAAGIPTVTYTDGIMTMDGAMGINIFDGSITVDNLALQDPLGIAPRLRGDVVMRNLDLDLLTHTFSFGAITGRLDGDVKNLVLSRWKPVQFDASFRSAPGKYSKKISQRAVENISALGGAGASAALQRSFLRFFKQFNYSAIGLSCKLRQGNCVMEGVEPTPGGYVIVKGSGIPAITVLGYNREVSWSELLSRIQGVIESNAAPIVK